MHLFRRRLSSCCGGHSAGMRAVLLPQPGPSSSLQFTREAATPTITAASQVKVRVSACAICHRDVLDRRGAFPFMQRPTILGHEIAGTVMDVGDNVTSLAVGDRVVSLHWSPCGSCAACSEGRPTHCGNSTKTFFGLTVNGGYSEYVVNGGNSFVKVPSGWSPIEAAPVMCTYGTVWHGAITRGRLRPAERVLVTGATGGVGSAAVQICSSLGCVVTAVTSSPSKAPLLKALGATHVIVCEPDKDGSMKFSSPGQDMVFEAVGEPCFGSSLRSLRAGGRLVLVGNVTAGGAGAGGAAKLPLGLAIIRGLSIIGSDSVSASELAATFAFLDAKGIRPHIHSVLPLEQAAQAHEELESRHVSGRIVLKIREDW